MRKLCMEGYSIKNGMQHEKRKKDKKGTDNSTRTHIRVAPFLSTINCATADTTNPAAAAAAATHLTVAWLQALDQQQQQ